MFHSVSSPQHVYFLSIYNLLETAKIQLFFAFDNLKAKKTMYLLSCLPFRGVRLPSVPLGFAAYMSVASLKNGVPDNPCCGINFC